MYPSLSFNNHQHFAIHVHRALRSRLLGPELKYYGKTELPGETHSCPRFEAQAYTPIKTVTFGNTEK